MRYFKPLHDLFTVTDSDDELRITTEFTEVGFHRPWDNYCRSSGLKIELLKGFQGKLEVTSKVGSINIKNGLELEELVINSQVGDITVCRTTAHFLTFFVSLGVQTVIIKLLLPDIFFWL